MLSLCGKVLVVCDALFATARKEGLPPRGVTALFKQVHVIFHTLDESGFAARNANQPVHMPHFYPCIQLTAWEMTTLALKVRMI